MPTSSPTLFGGDVHDAYERFLSPLLFESYADDLARRTVRTPVTKPLETACGTGVLTRRLRASLPSSVELVATDVADSMLATARDSLRDAPALVFQTVDATTLPFEDEAFDAVCCQFGVMFFEDKKQGFGEAHRVLAPGGRFLFNVWDALIHNELAHAAHTFAQKRHQANPPQFMKRPFAYHDVQEIESGLREVGFEEIAYSTLTKTSRSPSAADVATAFGRGTPLGAEMAERGDLDFLGDLEQAIAKDFGTGDIRASMRALVFVAHKSR